MFKNSAFWQKKVRDFSFNSGVYLMCELEASNNTERSNKIETLISRDSCCPHLKHQSFLVHWILLNLFQLVYPSDDLTYTEEIMLPCKKEKQIIRYIFLMK